MSKKVKSSKFGLFSMVVFGINCIVGAGIFLIPAKGYVQLGTNIFYMLIVCAVLATLMAFCFAEMGGKFTKTGGVYVYVRETFGSFWGFQIGFLRYIVGCIALATELVAITTMLSQFQPWFATTTGNITTSMVILLVLCVIIYSGVKSSRSFNNIIGFLKIAPIVFFIVTGIFFVKFHNFHAPDPGVINALNHTTLASGFLLAFYAFLGFENIGVAAGDIENPTKNIPKAIIITMIVVTLFNILVVFNAIGILGQNLATTKNPVAQSIQMYLGSWGLWIVVAASVISIFGISFTMAFAGARNMIPLAQDNFFPHTLSDVGEKGTPGRAIVLFGIATAVITILGITISKDSFSFLAIIGTIGRLIQYIAVSIAVVPSRKKFKGTFILKGAKILVPIAIIVCLIAIFQIDMTALLVGVVLLIGITEVVYFLYSGPRHKKMVSSKKSA